MKSQGDPLSHNLKVEAYRYSLELIESVIIRKRKKLYFHACSRSKPN